MFLKIVRFEWRQGFKLIALICIILSIKIVYESEETEYFDNPAKESRNHKYKSTPSNSSITLFVRMAGKLKQHRTRFYCDLYRTAVLFWPASFGKTVVVLDEESEQDHIFAKTLTSQISQHFADRKLEVAFESLPKDPSVLNFNGSRFSTGYNRQLWSSFLIDLYTNDAVVAWIDNDVAFLTPVTEATIFNGPRIRILGSQCSTQFGWVQNWARVTEIALGFPMVADFMTYFPVYIYRDTFTHCREYILKRFNTSNFEEAFKKSYNSAHLISPVNVVLSYAWFFERDRYDWNLKMCCELDSYNTRFPEGHKIEPQYTEEILSQPQTALHIDHTYRIQTTFFLPNIFISYCLSQRAADNQEAICSNRSFSADTNLVLFNHDLMKLRRGHESPCTGSNRNYCLENLERHYNQVGTDIKQGRQIKWRDLENVERLAKKADITCKYSV